MHYRGLLLKFFAGGVCPQTPPLGWLRAFGACLGVTVNCYIRTPPFKKLATPLMNTGQITLHSVTTSLYSHSCSTKS